MERLRMKSPDAVDRNVTEIAALFPHCVTERKAKDGSAELAIDFDKLRAELSKDVLEEGEERYQFTWPDKRAASRLANTAIDKTLRPDLDASKDFWNTENLYIEGDNLDVLKVLRENYLGKILTLLITPVMISSIMMTSHRARKISRQPVVCLTRTATKSLTLCSAILRVMVAFTQTGLI